MLPVNRANIQATYKEAMALQSAGRLDAARVRYEALAKVAPKLPEVPFQLGRIALAQRAPAQAVAHLEQAATLRPQEPAILSALAEAQGATGDTGAALKLYDRLIKGAPKVVKHRADKALLLQRTGDFDGAETAFRKALRLAPKDGELYRLFLASKKLKRGDPLIKAMQAAWAEPSVQGRGRIQLGYALSKAMEDIGDTDRVFPYLRAANEAQRKAFPYDVDQRRAEVDGLIEAFAGAEFSPIPTTADDIAPIFVTGLPRSGTTLVEQILAAHPLVQSGGEMRHVLALAYDLMGSPGQFKPFRSATENGLAQFATQYRDALRAQHSFDRGLTDKSIQTHLVLGLVAKAIPNARVIVVRRDPRDMGLSIYKNLFADGTHLYASSLEDIAAYTATFEKMLGFWREVLPDRFTEIAYEDLVADPETQSRALVQAAGLDWDPACLTFHQNTGRVETLSLAQVRQPIHGRSARGWQKYAKDLRPLTEALAREGVHVDDA